MRESRSRGSVRGALGNGRPYRDIPILIVAPHWQIWWPSGHQDKMGKLYPEHTVPDGNGVGYSAENWCVMPKLGNYLYLAIDAGPIHDEDGNLVR